MRKRTRPNKSNFSPLVQSFSVPVATEILSVGADGVSGINALYMNGTGELLG